MCLPNSSGRSVIVIEHEHSTNRSSIGATLAISSTTNNTAPMELLRFLGCVFSITISPLEGLYESIPYHFNLMRFPFPADTSRAMCIFAGGQI